MGDTGGREIRAPSKDTGPIRKSCVVTPKKGKSGPNFGNWTKRAKSGKKPGF